MLEAWRQITLGELDRKSLPDAVYLKKYSTIRRDASV